MNGIHKIIWFCQKCSKNVTIFFGLIYIPSYLYWSILKYKEWEYFSLYFINEHFNVWFIEIKFITLNLMNGKCKKLPSSELIQYLLNCSYNIVIISEILFRPVILYLLLFEIFRMIDSLFISSLSPNRSITSLLPINIMLFRKTCSSSVPSFLAPFFK